LEGGGEISTKWVGCITFGNVLGRVCVVEKSEGTERKGDE